MYVSILYKPTFDLRLSVFEYYLTRHKINFFSVNILIMKNIFILCDSRISSLFFFIFCCFQFFDVKLNASFGVLHNQNHLLIDILYFVFE